MATTQNIKTIAGKALLSGAVALAGLGLASGTAHAFNPQPDPPGMPHFAVVQQSPLQPEIGNGATGVHPGGPGPGPGGTVTTGKVPFPGPPTPRL
jgi:hypothetical protein